jgi:signal transduction histidine kinase
MYSLRTLNSRLVLSHLAVSVLSILLMAVFAGRSIYQASIAEAEHNLQGLAAAVANFLELPIQQLEQNQVEPKYIQDVLDQMFIDNPNIQYTVYLVDGLPLADSSGEMPPRANRANAPEVFDALENPLSQGIRIRNDPRGVRMLYIAVLVQRENEIIAILRLGTPMQATQDSARRSLLILGLTSIAILTAVGMFGWILANNLAAPIQSLTQAAGKMERGELGARVKPAGPEELRRLAEAFNSMANRLQSNVNELRAFVANASHELRTPLTVIKLRTEALRDGALEDKKIASRFIDEIETEINRLVRMVNDLLDLSRMEAGLSPSKRIPVDLGKIASEVRNTFAIRAAQAEVQLTLDIESDIQPILGNEDQVRRVLYNLVENAIKHTPSRGTIEMLIRPGPKENILRFLVRDTGPGIAPEHISHVFERFYRADAGQTRPGTLRGSGLGLAIAKSIVENHAGQIGVNSQLGSGATFWTDWPVAADEQNNGSS